MVSSSARNVLPVETEYPNVQMAQANKETLVARRVLDNVLGRVVRREVPVNTSITVAYSV
jgi:hypothetical protein